MVPIQNARVLFNSVPEGVCGSVVSHPSQADRDSGYPIPGETTVYDTSQTIDPETVPLNGGFLTKTLVLSIDPYLRGKMRNPEKKSYSVRPQSCDPPCCCITRVSQPGFQLGAP